MFSLVVPHYNHADVLRRALRHTDEIAERLVVDDGSRSDQRAAAEAVCADLGVGFAALPENRGPGAARNHGAAGTTAPWLVFLDADDALLPGFAEAVGEFLAGHPEVDAVHPGIRYHGLDRPLDPVRKQNLDAVIPSGLVVRRTVFDRLGGFPTDPAFLGTVGGEDLALVNALIHLAEFRYWPKTLVESHAGWHMKFFLERTRVEDGRIRFLRNTEEELDGTLDAAFQRYWTEAKRRFAGR